MSHAFEELILVRMAGNSHQSTTRRQVADHSVIDTINIVPDQDSVHGGLVDEKITGEV